jgi:ribosome-associated protein
MNTPAITSQPINPPETTIIITRLPIRLGQFLKHAGIVENGLEAKMKIRNGEVSVNGQPESRRGKQLFHGDRISMGYSLYIVEGPD